MAYRSLRAKALGIRQGQVIRVQMTDTGLDVSGVNPGQRDLVVDSVGYDSVGRLRVRPGSDLQRTGATVRLRG